MFERLKWQTRRWQRPLKGASRQRSKRAYCIRKFCKRSGNGTMGTRLQINMQKVSGKRYYGGREYVDIGRRALPAKSMRGIRCGAANVQPHSGAQANIGGVFAVLNPGTPYLVLNLADVSFEPWQPGKYFGGSFNVVPYEIDDETHRKIMKRLKKRQSQAKPKMKKLQAQALIQGD